MKVNGFGDPQATLVCYSNETIQNFQLQTLGASPCLHTPPSIPLNSPQI